MRNMMKKIVVMLLAMVMVLGTYSTVFAATLTINGSDTAATAGHTYKVYQIYTGDLATKDGKQVLSNVKYGKNYGTEGDEVSETELNGITDADDYAEKVVASDNFHGDPVATLDSTVNFTATLDDGYYLIIDDTSATGIGDKDTFSKYMVQIIGTVTMNPKSATAPTFIKKVKDTNDTTGVTTEWQDSADYDIGDLVPFKLTATVPANYADYETYYMSFNDTLTNMALQASTIVVKVNGTELDNEDYYIYGSYSSFQVVIYDLKDTAAKAGDEVTVEYSAMLLNTANLGSEGNPNVATLTYSNNPENTDKGTPNTGDTPGTPEGPDTPSTPDKPDNDTPDNHGTPDTPDDTDNTLEDKNIVFTYQVVANKVDGSNQPLADAKFELFKNVNGTYTSLGEIEQTEVKNDDGEVTGYTFKWTGLDDGDYKIVETQTPAGYNTIDDQEFTVSATHTNDPETLALTEFSGEAKTGSVITLTADKTAGTVTTNIENKAGAVLPTTGGIGTTIFYVLGSILVLGAGVVLVTRRRVAR